MEDFEKQIKRKLFRAFCPDALELGEFHTGALKGEQAEIIRKHLEECRYCREEISQLERYQNSLSPELDYSPAEKIKIWIAKRFPGMPSTGLGLAPAFAMRGSGEGSLHYQAREADITLEIRPDPRQPRRKTLLGLVTGVASPGLRATLWQEGQLITRSEVDELGNLALSALRPGGYDLVISGETFEIHIQDLQVT